MLLAAAVAGAVARWIPEPAVAWMIWADRDLTRAAEVGHVFPTSGPELTRGSRTPGGFFSLWMAAQLLLTDDPLALHRLMVVLNVAGWALLAWITWRIAGAVAGAAVLALGMVSPAQLRLLPFVAYNPNYPLLFAAGAYGAFLAAVGRAGIARRWALMVALVCAAAQMHLSFLLLLPGMWLGLRRELAVCGRRCAWLALAVFAAFYAPFFVAEVVQGWAVLGEVQRHHRLVVNSPWSYPFTSSVSLAGELWRGWKNLVFALFSGPWPADAPSGPRLALGYAGCVAFLATAAWAIAARRREDPAARLVRRLLVVLATGLLLMSLSNVNFPDRYVLFLAPAAVLVIAIGAERAIARAASGPAPLAAALAGVAIAAAFLGATVRPWMTAEAHPDVSVRQWQGLLARLSADLGHQPADVASRAAVVIRRPAEWSNLSAETAAITFLARRAASKAAAPVVVPPPCALVLVAPAGGAVDDWPAIVKQNPAAAPLEVSRVLEVDARSTIVAYRARNGNCLANLGNRYQLTPEEEDLARWRPSRPGAVAEARPQPDGTRYYVRLVHRFPWRRPLEMRIDVHAEGGRVRAVLHSNDLRGYDGISAYHVTRPRLVWRDASGAAREQVLVDGVIGGWFNLVRAPWIADEIALPAGPHDASLAWDDVQFEEYGGHEGAGTLPLPGPPLAVRD